MVLVGASPTKVADPALEEDIHGILELEVLRNGSNITELLEGDILGNGGVVVVDGIQNREQGRRVLAVDPDPTEKWRSILEGVVAVRAFLCDEVVLGLRVHHVLEHGRGQGQMAGGYKVSAKVLGVPNESQNDISSRVKGVDELVSHLERGVLGESLGMVMWSIKCEIEMRFVGSGASFMSVHEGRNENSVCCPTEKGLINMCFDDFFPPCQGRESRAACSRGASANVSIISTKSEQKSNRPGTAISDVSTRLRGMKLTVRAEA